MRVFLVKRVSPAHAPPLVATALLPLQAERELRRSRVRVRAQLGAQTRQDRVCFEVGVVPALHARSPTKTNVTFPFKNNL